MSDEWRRQCAATTTRRSGLKRRCGQISTFVANGKQWCFYHNPENPHKFGEKKKQLNDKE